MKLAKKIIGICNESDLSKALSNIDKQFSRGKKPTETNQVEFKFSDGGSEKITSSMEAHRELKHLQRAKEQFEDTISKKGETALRNKLLAKTNKRISELSKFISDHNW